MFVFTTEIDSNTLSICKLVIFNALFIFSIVVLIYKYKYPNSQMNSPLKTGDIWTRRRHSKKKKVKFQKDDNSNSITLENARQNRGMRMREFAKKRQKASINAKERQEYLINGKNKNELLEATSTNTSITNIKITKLASNVEQCTNGPMVKIVSKEDQGDNEQSISKLQPTDILMKDTSANTTTDENINNWALVEDEQNRIKKKIVVEYEDTESRTNSNYADTMEKRIRKRAPHFEINDKDISWTI